MYIYIRSMSEYQREVYRKLVSASDQIDLHIIKILMFRNSQYVDHWMHEIWSFLFRVDKIKGKNKWPKESFLYNALSVHNDTIENYLVIAEDSEDGLDPISVSADLALDCVNRYQKWLSNKLSAHGVVRQSDVKDKLKEICRL